MTAAAQRQRMTHRATIERSAPSETNDYGHAGPPDWEALEDALPCFLHYRRSGIEDVEAERTAVIEEAVLLAPVGADVTEQDRINGIEDRAGNVLLAGVVNIRTVRPIRRSHVEVVLEGVV